MTVEEQEEKEQLLEEVYFFIFASFIFNLTSTAVFLFHLIIFVVCKGFSTWSRRDFHSFIRACEKYGRDDTRSIAFEMEGKTEEEVERYARVFKERYKELNGK